MWGVSGFGSSRSAGTLRGLFLVVMAVVGRITCAPSAWAAAQVDSPFVRAASAITAERLAQHLAILAADSLRDRNTPSPALERTAHYVVDAFTQFGLQPYGDETRMQPGVRDTGWFQRYRLPGQLQLDYAQTRLLLGLKMMGQRPVMNEQGWNPMRHIPVPFGPQARFAVDSVPESGAWCCSAGAFEWAPLPAYVVAGPQTVASLQQAAIRDGLVVYVPPPGLTAAAQRPLLDQLRKSNQVLVLANEDGPTFAARADSARQRPLAIIDQDLEDRVDVKHWVIAVQPDSVAGLLEAAGIVVDQVRASDKALVQKVALPFGALVQPKVIPVQPQAQTAPNVVGFLPGTAPVEWGQRESPFLLFTAHMDRGAADADHDASLAVLLELARAFSQAGARPRRPVVFLALSGSEAMQDGARALFGSTNWVNNARHSDDVEVVINLDGLGRDTAQAVVMEGLNDFDFDRRPDWAAAAHPELGLRIVAGESAAISDHVLFLRKATPALSLHDLTVHSTGPIDVKRLAQIAQLAFYVGHDLGNLTRGPVWNATGRRKRDSAYWP